jgi:hypothetical protein
MLVFRTKTTFIIGAGAGYEIEMPDPREMLAKIAQGFDFSRLGSELQTRDMVVLGKHFERFSTRINTTPEKLQDAAGAIRQAARVTGSIDSILEQHGHDPLVQLAGKLAIVHYTLQAESRSPLGIEPRDPGDLPLRGNENWLYQLGRMLVAGVPRGKAEQCFDNLSVINFNYDRSLQHYLPWVLQMAFGMTLSEARQLVAAKLKIIYPIGSVGRLPWELGESPGVDWGIEEPANLDALVNQVLTITEMRNRPKMAENILAEVAGAKRIVFLGFGFDPLHTDVLIDDVLGQDPDLLVSLTGIAEAPRGAVLRTLARLTGVEESLISMQDVRAFQLLRDYSLFLES